MSSITRAKKEKPSEPPSLPEDVIFDITARVSRCDYPTLSLVSKHFKSLVRSPELYARRSLLGCGEHCLYAVHYSIETNCQRLYMLRRKTNGNHCLVHIPSLPAMRRNGRYVAVGSKIYVFGQIYEYGDFNMTPIALSFDCRSHMVQPLPSMPIVLNLTKAAVFIDGKIYVIGYCDNDSKKAMMVVFNTETQMWEKDKIKLCDTRPNDVVMMGDKMYIRDYGDTFVYEPTESICEREDMLNLAMCRNACVVDDVLYYHDCVKNKFRMYDPKKRCWGVVNGLEQLLAKTILSRWSETVGCGVKLTLFFSIVKSGLITGQIWCVEISLERRHEEEIWGKVEWCDQIMIPGNSYITKSLAVML
ncbi:unnamed protein product [Microthlaspi erraticum]|uniref:F-box domain-containing protein n=1 Tax=Microthlaspi erraticum TaxID=1685480 RepID=A0A6D2KFR1_9BRAS|nr:unnamed protein product [Microthlaspi erraticum]